MNLHTVIEKLNISHTTENTLLVEWLRKAVGNFEVFDVSGYKPPHIIYVRTMRLNINGRILIGYFDKIFVS